MLMTLAIFAVFIACVLITDVTSMILQIHREREDTRVKARSTRHF